VPITFSLESPVDPARLTVENAADSNFVMDGVGHAVFANAAAERAFGWPEQKPIGHPLHDMV
jgi:PAS domain S-box-containing protein